MTTNPTTHKTICRRCTPVDDEHPIDLDAKDGLCLTHYLQGLNQDRRFWIIGDEANGYYVLDTDLGSRSKTMEFGNAIELARKLEMRWRQARKGQAA